MGREEILFDGEFMMRTRGKGRRDRDVSPVLVREERESLGWEKEEERRVWEKDKRAPREKADDAPFSSNHLNGQGGLLPRRGS